MSRSRLFARHYRPKTDLATSRARNKAPSRAATAFLKGPIAVAGLLLALVACPSAFAQSSNGQLSTVGETYPASTGPAALPPVTQSSGGWIHYNNSILTTAQTQSEQTDRITGRPLLGGGCSFHGQSTLPAGDFDVVEEETAYNPYTCEADVVRASVTASEMSRVEALSQASAGAVPPDGQPTANEAPPTVGSSGAGEAAPSGASKPPSIAQSQASAGTHYESAHTKAIWRDPVSLNITSLVADLSWPLYGAPGAINSTAYSYEFPLDSWSNSGLKGPFLTESSGLYPDEKIKGDQKEAEQSLDWYSSAHETFHNSDFAAFLKKVTPLVALAACGETNKETEFYHNVKVFGYRAGPTGYWWEDHKKGACSNLVHHVTYYNPGWEGPEHEATGMSYHGIIASTQHESQAEASKSLSTGVPSVTTHAATPLKAGEVSLNGEVNPNGGETGYKFEYGTSEAYGSSTPEVSAGSGTGSQFVSSFVKELQPGAIYHYRLMATNAGGTGYGPDETFRAPQGPVVATEPATAVLARSATLAGSVNPNALETHYYFEYGPTPSYGDATPEYALSGSEDGVVPVGIGVTGLRPRTTYYYRVVASNSVGTSYGAQHAFETLPGWTIQATPNPGGLQGIKVDELRGVSCWASVACSAAGEYLDSEGEVVGLVEQLSGTTWEVQGIPSPPSATGDTFESIACVSSTACTATGYYENAVAEHLTLAAAWNGTTWVVQTTPTSGTSADLASVSCSAANACTAVGQTVNNGKTAPLVERWNGKVWKAQTVATPAGYEQGWFEGVSCSAAKSCTAVGGYYASVQSGRALAEHWDGKTWSVQPTPELKSTDFDVQLRGVSCLEANVCVAVGGFQNAVGHGREALAEIWNGTSWQLQETPSPTGNEATEKSQWELSGISCSSSTLCAAVGSYNNSPGHLPGPPLGEIWNGASWELELPATKTGVESNSLKEISCFATECIAVGRSQANPTHFETLAERLELP